jgi:hypothetical protein
LTILFIGFSFCFFYERVIRNFGNDEVIELVPPLSIEKLAYLALDSPESNWTPEDGDKDSIVNVRYIRNLLILIFLCSI